MEIKETKTYKVLNEAGYQIAAGQTKEEAVGLRLAAAEMSSQEVDVICEQDGKHC